ncbi:hypothetical protein LOK49_Contig112G00001 [Camellia lanceoleosa]|nr:hypothetical protein LOK49_Contig112G00001 [Camellia lanceoleosa]
MKGGVVEGTGRVCEEFSAGVLWALHCQGYVRCWYFHLATTPLMSSKSICSQCHTVMLFCLVVDPVAEYHGISVRFEYSCGKEQGPLPFGEVGLANSLDIMVFKSGCKFGLYEYFKKLILQCVLVDHNKEWGRHILLPAVHLLKYLLMWLSVPFAEAASRVSCSKHSPILSKGF